MRTIIAGSRHIDSYIVVSNAIAESGWRAQIGEVVCGMAPGVDTLGRIWAERWGIPVKQFPADWNQYGKAAGPIRNKKMAEYAVALILIWDGKSRGSANMRWHANNLGLWIYEHVIDNV